MPYSKEHKEKSRERILASAAKLFPHLGYEAVSIDKVTEHAGMTRGAFYAHFSNKAQLYAEAMLYATRLSPFHLFGKKETTNQEWFERTIAKYLHREHITDASAPCPLAFLVTDINRQDPGVRDTYTHLYTNLVKLISERVTTHGVTSDNVMAVTALMVGGVALASALNDEKTGDRLLQACRNLSRELLETE